MPNVDGDGMRKYHSRLKKAINKPTADEFKIIRGLERSESDAYNGDHHICFRCAFFHQIGIGMRSDDHVQPELVKLLSLLHGPHDGGDVEARDIGVVQEALQHCAADVACDESRISICISPSANKKRTYPWLQSEGR